MDFLLKNEFVVMALDAMLHLSSVFVLAVICVLACKLLTRGFVDAKLFTGLMIATLLVITRVFLLNNIDRALPGVGGALAEVLIIFCLFLTAFILVYKLVAIPVIGTTLSSIVIVFAQISLANYIPVLSLKLMPEGQRFAEYAGIANDRTKKLMNEAKAFRGQSGGIRRILADAAEAIKFFTSDEQQEQLSKDFASGIALYKARKEYMDNMSPEELAAYRKAMSEFLAEQGLAENRYSLSNLKNAKPEDLENLANFMKDMNEVYGFTDDLPDREGLDPEDLPSSAESLAVMAQSLSKIDMSSGEMAKLNSLFSDLGIDTDTVLAGMAQARDDLAEIRDISSKMAGEFKRLIPEGMEAPSLPGGGETDLTGENVILSGGYRIKKIPKAPTFSGSVFIEERSDDTAPSIVTDEVTYYLPESASAIPGGDVSETGFLAQSYETLEPMDLPVPVIEENYFEREILAPISTEQSVFLIPSEEEEKARWTEIAEQITIDAWFASAEEGGKSTIIIEGIGLKDGDILEEDFGGETYRFRFEGIQDNLVTLQALERVAADDASPPIPE